MPPVAAQTHRVAATETVTRAVAVYEWTGDLAKPTAARMVPVSLFIDGAFQDAGTFYSRPVPLALLNGNIYSLEKSGAPQGNVTLEYARHLQTATSAGGGDIADLGWFGYGNFAALPAPKKAPPLKAEKHLSAIVSSKDEDKPHFTNRAEKASPESSTTTRTDTASTTTPSVDDPDRPRFSKAPSTPSTADTTVTTPAKTSSQTEASADSAKPATTSKSSESDVDPDRPTLRHRDPKQAEQDRKARAQSGVTALPGSLNNDPDRPTMKRGSPAGAEAAPTQLSGLPAAGALHQSVAISDAVNREPHPFLREWASPTEQSDVMVKLQAIAQTQLTDYAHRNGSTALPEPKITAKPSARAHRATAQPTPTPIPAASLTNEQLQSYTLSYGGLPTFVYSAIAANSSASSGVGPTPPDRYVTVVAQQLPSGEIQVALTSVTDAAHLDRTPWFRLVDVVDPDAGHRASLLFELRSQTSRQFALYRILSAKADQIFITNPTE